MTDTIAKKMWDGRFMKETDRAVNDFNSSIRFDNRLYAHDIQGSMAHANMLEAVGILSADDNQAIQTGLKEILRDIESGDLAFDRTAEDIHMFVEAELTERIGDAGKRLHTGRSRNDQVATDLKLYLKAEANKLLGDLLQLTKETTELAAHHIETVMPGYTHLQRAQPLTFGHHMMAYALMFRRDCTRLADALKRMDTCPLGSGALAGTTYPLDRRMVATELGFSDITENSLDGVSDRDYCLELASVLAIFMTHLSRLSEEIILWSSQEFHFVDLDDAYATGSSIMPQKKNPDVAELARGKTGRVIGDLMTLLTMMKGLPLAYNKDMQEDKEAIFDAFDTVNLCLPAFTGMLSTMTVNKENMRTAAKGGFTNATDLADYLVMKGLPFREAHAVSGRLVHYCIEHNTVLEALTLNQLKAESELFEEDIFEAISLEACIARRTLAGGPAPSAVQAAIDSMRNWLENTQFER